MQRIKNWAEVAAKLGAPVLRVFADTQMRAQTWETVSNGAKRDEVEKWIADDIRACADHAAKFGVIIGVQNHGDFLKTADNLIWLIKRIDSPWCGAIVDTGYFKAADPYAEMAKAAPYAVNWQIKQSPFGVEKEAEAPTDLIRLLKIVRASGYRGYLPIETLSAAAAAATYDPFTVVPKFLAELRAAIEATAPPPPKPRNPQPVRKPPPNKPPSPTEPPTPPPPFSVQKSASVQKINATWGADSCRCGSIPMWSATIRWRKAITDAGAARRQRLSTPSEDSAFPNMRRRENAAKVDALLRESA